MLNDNVNVCNAIAIAMTMMKKEMRGPIGCVRTHRRLSAVVAAVIACVARLTHCGARI